MPFPWKICVVCGEEFELRPDKPGYANRCMECTKQDAAAAGKQSSSKPGLDATERQNLSEMNEARRNAMRNMLYRKDS